MAFASSSSAQNFPMKFKPTWCFSGEEVMSTSGNHVEVELGAENTMRSVLESIAGQMDVCKCKLSFVCTFRDGSWDQVRYGLYVKRYFEALKEGRLKLHRTSFSPKLEDLKSYYTDDHVCLKCLREAGFLAKDFMDKKIWLTADEFKRAGYTLKDLLHCFSEFDHPRRRHPPASKFTLFDTQLKDAGYEAKDFKDAGYSASQLSAHEAWHCEHPEGLTPGDIEWVDVGAYFTATELAFAGYSASELLAARFPKTELLSAGFAVQF